MIMLFKERREWEDKYEQWIKENQLKDCSYNVISFLVAKGWTPVIKCKDCKHWNEHYRECQSPNWETGTDQYIVQPHGAYCYWGERR